MAYEFKFSADAVLRNKAYPALAEWSARPYTPEWREFRYHWPYTVPCELHEHCRIHKFPYSLSRVEQSHGHDNFYTVGLGWFDFEIDYFSLIPKQVFEKKLTILFYYHEGDDPRQIKQRLDSLCDQHDLPVSCYRFVSGNTCADTLDGFTWFPDHELLYWSQNRRVPATSVHLNSRPYRFTILNRTHKWWRATVMTNLQKAGILANSQWSYNTQLSLDENLQDNPLRLDYLQLRNDLDNFMAQGPYTCDNLTSEQHNHHHLHVPTHYTNSYCNIVLETLYDVGQSGGVFLTEKTFKPIKHGQPFVIVGPPGSLQALRDLGYRTFDHAIDNSYDQEKDATLRWLKLLSTIQQINARDPDAWFASCLDDILHNQQLFLSSKYNRLNTLYDKLLHQLAAP